MEKNMNKLKNNEFHKLIAKKSNDPININLSGHIIFILGESYKKYKVFKHMTVLDITNNIFKTKRIYCDKLDHNERDLFIRTELYKLKNKNYIKFNKYKKSNYTVQLTNKGLNYYKSLVINYLTKYYQIKGDVFRIEVNDF
jgi:hypothetical protein|tara:strand:- start:1029 stop:1451 length:423 start_codon:yes stop_codon:yes gene_type:complete